MSARPEALADTDCLFRTESAGTQSWCLPIQRIRYTVYGMGEKKQILPWYHTHSNNQFKIAFLPFSPNMDEAGRRPWTAETPESAYWTDSLANGKAWSDLCFSPSTITVSRAHSSFKRVVCVAVEHRTKSNETALIRDWLVRMMGVKKEQCVILQVIWISKFLA